MTATVALTRPAARVDLYAPIHKALRLIMTDTLQRVGRMDSDDAAETAATLDQLDALLMACRIHLDKENRYLHTAIEARRPGATARVADEHAQHLDAIAALEAAAAATRAAPSAPAAQRLYRQLGSFVADNLEHMEVEETQLNAALWATHDDTELLAIQQRIVAATEPAQMALVLRWMVPALNPAERVAMLAPMHSTLPPEAMRGVLETVRPHLDDIAWAKLARALNLPAASAPSRA